MACCHDDCEKTSPLFYSSDTVLEVSTDRNNKSIKIKNILTSLSSAQELFGADLNFNLGSSRSFLQDFIDDSFVEKIFAAIKELESNASSTSTISLPILLKKEVNGNNVWTKTDISRASNGSSYIFRFSKLSEEFVKMLKPPKQELRTTADLDFSKPMKPAKNYLNFYDLEILWNEIKCKCPERESLFTCELCYNRGSQLCLGVGSYALVYYALWMGTPVAVKAFNKPTFSSIKSQASDMSNSDMSQGAPGDLNRNIDKPSKPKESDSESRKNARILDSFRRELNVLKSLRHPNIIGLYGYDKDQLYLVMEVARNGCLADKIRLNRNREFVNIVWPIHIKISLELVSGLRFLHERGIIHGDLKSFNILLDSNYTVKIADFGTSGTVNDKPTDSPLSIAWAAPERLLGEPISMGADIYAIAIILWELATMELPYNNFKGSPQKLASQILHAKLRPEIQDYLQTLLSGYRLPPLFIFLIQRTWQSKAESRLSLNQVYDILLAVKSCWKCARCGWFNTKEQTFCQGCDFDPFNAKQQENLASKNIIKSRSAETGSSVIKVSESNENIMSPDLKPSLIPRPMQYIKSTNDGKTSNTELKVDKLYDADKDIEINDDEFLKSQKLSKNNFMETSVSVQASRQGERKENFSDMTQSQGLTSDFDEEENGSETGQDTSEVPLQILSTREVVSQMSLSELSKFATNSSTKKILGSALKSKFKESDAKNIYDSNLSIMSNASKKSVTFSGDTKKIEGSMGVQALNVDISKQYPSHLVAEESNENDLSQAEINLRNFNRYAESKQIQERNTRLYKKAKFHFKHMMSRMKNVSAAPDAKPVQGLEEISLIKPKPNIYNSLYPQKKQRTAEVTFQAVLKQKEDVATISDKVDTGFTERMSNNSDNLNKYTQDNTAMNRGLSDVVMLDDVDNSAKISQNKYDYSKYTKSCIVKDCSKCSFHVKCNIQLSKNLHNHDCESNNSILSDCEERGNLKVKSDPDKLNDQVKANKSTRQKQVEEQHYSNINAMLNVSINDREVRKTEHDSIDLKSNVHVNRRNLAKVNSYLNEHAQRITTQDLVLNDENNSKFSEIESVDLGTNSSSDGYGNTSAGSAHNPDLNEQSGSWECDLCGSFNQEENSECVSCHANRI